MLRNRNIVLIYERIRFRFIVDVAELKFSLGWKILYTKDHMFFPLHCNLRNTKYTLHAWCALCTFELSCIEGKIGCVDIRNDEINNFARVGTFQRCNHDFYSPNKIYNRTNIITELIRSNDKLLKILKHRLEN